jgi:hypothetical protein
VTAGRTRHGRSWIVTGGVFALVGLAIILWPEPGFTPHPLPFPPSASTRPIAGYAVFGYPLLTLGLLVALAGALRAAVAAVSSRRR